MTPFCHIWAAFVRRNDTCEGVGAGVGAASGGWRGAAPGGRRGLCRARVSRAACGGGFVAGRPAGLRGRVAVCRRRDHETVARQCPFPRRGGGGERRRPARPAWCGGSRRRVPAFARLGLYHGHDPRTDAGANPCRCRRALLWLTFSGLCGRWRLVGRDGARGRRACTAADVIPAPETPSFQRCGGHSAGPAP